MPAMTSAVVGVAPGEAAATASALLQVSRQVGSVLGVVLLGALVGRHATQSGIAVALVVAGTAMLGGALIAVRAIRHCYTLGRV